MEYYTFRGYKKCDEVEIFNAEIIIKIYFTFIFLKQHNQESIAYATHFGINNDQQFYFVSIWLAQIG